MKHLRLFLAFLALTLSPEAYSLSLTELTPDTHCDIDVSYEHYNLCYSQEHLQAFWTFHLLTKESINGKQKRTNNFRKDYDVYPTVDSRDYKGSGYDRGHMVPAGDMKLNRTSMSETFYMTNMSPQKSGFNSGVWRALEEGLRNQVRKRSEAFVVTGPVLLPFTNYKRIQSGVSIPDEYYKIAYFPEEQTMLAFLIPNASQRGRSYTTFQVSVDELETLTGYDFFAELEDELEEELESEFSKL